MIMKAVYLRCLCSYGPLRSHASFTFVLSFVSSQPPEMAKACFVTLSEQLEHPRHREGGGRLGHKSLELLLVASLVSDPRSSLRPL